MTFQPVDLNKVQTLIDIAVEEDYGNGDPTSYICISEDKVAETYLISRQDLIVCGMDIAKEVLMRYDKDLCLDVYIQDGNSAEAGQRIAKITGPLRQMLSAERVLLNFLQRLSGIATLTSEYVSKVQGTKAQICDTRKTTPGWRELEKYAVRCGGGTNHRYNLSDAVMLKDNHFAHLGQDHKKELTRFVKMAKETPGVEFVSVEVDHIEGQLETVLDVEGIDIVLLDNMSLDQMSLAVKMRDRRCGDRPLLEASGGITIERLYDIALTGIDRISIGAITHSATAIDIGLDK